MFSPDSSGYEAIRRPACAAYREVRPRLVVLCRSVSDIARAMAYAAQHREDRIAPRGGGHCFAGRQPTGSRSTYPALDGISAAGNRVPTIGADVRLGQAYAALHAYGQTLPAGCGPTVGITGLTLAAGSVCPAASTG